MSENYLTAFQRRLENEIINVTGGAVDREVLINFVTDEVRASFKRGLVAGNSPYKKSPHKKAPYKR